MRPKAVRAALADLGRGLLPLGSLTKGLEVVSEIELPEPADRLLVHHRHMTVVLQGFYRRPVELKVLRDQQDGEQYSRMILLTLSGSRRIVEFGIVRLDLEKMPAAARKEILDRAAPLGDVLIRHRVLRRVVPRAFIRYRPPSPVLSYLGRDEDDQAYGRIASIYCKGEPAIELLEVVG
jgi:chorismate-pyruvate lyase